MCGVFDTVLERPVALGPVQGPDSLSGEAVAKMHKPTITPTSINMSGLGSPFPHLQHDQQHHGCS